MPTSRADRLSKLFEGDWLPPPDPNKPHIADTEIFPHVKPVQRSWEPKLAQAPTKVTQPPGKKTEIHQPTSSDDDDEYVCAFKKAPSTKTGTTVEGRTKTSTPSGFPNDQRRRPNVSASTSADGAEKSGHEWKEDDGVSNVDQDGHLLIGRFCPLTLVTKFCYKYMDDPNDDVSKYFFASGKIWQRAWDIYYIYPAASTSPKPILLVPETQVRTLLEEIHSEFGIPVKLPRDPFLLAFYHDGTPAPIRIGICQDRDAVAKVEKGIPPPSSEYGVCPSNASPELEKAIEGFKAKMERAIAAQKKKSVATKKSRVKDRLSSVHGSWGEALKRGQRYLGLRPLDDRGDLPMPNTSMPGEEQLKSQRAQKITRGTILEPLDVEKTTPHAFDGNVVFVSVDVEAFERAPNLITEVGVSTLDTAHIESLPPGPGGVNWMQCIRSRHFRISDHAHLRNTSFCIGDPEKFLFGRSEFVSMDQIGLAVDSCFQPPYSADFVHDGQFRAQDETGGTSIETAQVDGKLQNMSLGSDESADGRTSSPQLSDQKLNVQGLMDAEHELGNGIAVYHEVRPAELNKDEEIAKQCLETDFSKNESTANRGIARDNSSSEQQSRYSNVILVGHDLNADLQYLSTLKSKVFHNPPAVVSPQPLQPEDCLRQRILETLDTARLYQAWRRETNMTSLAKVLGAVERTGWQLHNAGNDARYTLEALIGLLIRARQQEDVVREAAETADGVMDKRDEKQAS